MGNWTPGPWEVADEVILCGDPDMAIGTVFPCDRDSSVYGSGFKYGEVSIANARLIAAAPELLEAAKIALAMLNRNLASEESCGQPFNGDDEHESRRVLTAAIAKATGGES